MQRAHDHEGVAVLAQQLLDLRQPALVAHRHERAIERGKGAKLARQEPGECGGVAAAPGVQHLLELLLRSLQLAHRLVEEAHLILARERLEAAELLAEGLEACGRLAVGVGAPYELLLDALLGVEALVQKLEIGELDADRPRRLAVEELDRRAELRRRRTHARVALLAEDAAERRARRQRCVLDHPAGRLERIELAEVELHHEFRGVGIGAVEALRQHRVLGRKQVHRAGEIDGVVRAANRPHGARGVSAQAAEQAEREEPSRCCATHTTSVSSEPSGRSSSVR